MSLLSLPTCPLRPCTPVPTECPVLSGYTVEANVDAPGSNLLSFGCSTFKVTPTTNNAQQGGALCTGRADCAGFTTYRWGDQTWACPKFWLSNTVTQPPARAACLYRKIGA